MEDINLEDLQSLEQLYTSYRFIKRRPLIENIENLKILIPVRTSPYDVLNEIETTARSFSLDDESSNVRLQSISKFVDSVCSIVVVFAKQVIGFTDILNTDDQIVLLRPFTSEASILWMANLYDPETESLALPDRKSYSIHSFVLAGFECIAQDLINLARTMHSMQITFTELAFLSVDLLNNPERTKLTTIARDTIKFVREAYQNSFEEYLENEYGSSQRINQLLELLLQTRAISRKLCASLMAYKNRIQASGLFHEIYSNKSL